MRDAPLSPGSQDRLPGCAPCICAAVNRVAVHQVRHEVVRLPAYSFIGDLGRCCESKVRGFASQEGLLGNMHPEIQVLRLCQVRRNSSSHNGACRAAGTRTKRKYCPREGRSV